MTLIITKLLPKEQRYDTTIKNDIHSNSNKFNKNSAFMRMHPPWTLHRVSENTRNPRAQVHGGDPPHSEAGEGTARERRQCYRPRRTAAGRAVPMHLRDGFLRASLLLRQDSGTAGGGRRCWMDFETMSSDIWCQENHSSDPFSFLSPIPLSWYSFTSKALTIFLRCVFYHCFFAFCCCCCAPFFCLVSYWLRIKNRSFFPLFVASSVLFLSSLLFYFYHYIIITTIILPYEWQHQNKSRNQTYSLMQYIQ